MKGNIYTRQKCPKCGGKMLHDERMHNCVCKQCKIPASKGYIVRFGRDTTKRFKSYPEAAQFLSGLRFKTAEGTFDKRDYQENSPLAFNNQADKWLSKKKREIGTETYRKYERFLKKARAVWGDKSIKEIKLGDIEDFLYDEKTAQNEKYRHDIRSCIDQLFSWISEREEIKKPKIPNIRYELAWRAITDLDTQQAIINECHRIAPEKVAFGIELLATYTSLRPDDLRRVKEWEYREGMVTFHNPTKSRNKSKVIKLVDQHVEHWEKLKRKYPAMPQVHFFRHHNNPGVKDDTPFGEGAFYNWWKRACKNLGVENLDLYGGTRHTTTTAIATLVDSESAKKASGHMTNVAFERYCQAADETAFEMATFIKNTPRKSDQQVININNKGKPAK